MLSVRILVIDILSTAPGHLRTIKLCHKRLHISESLLILLILRGWRAYSPKPFLLLFFISCSLYVFIKQFAAFCTTHCALDIAKDHAPYNCPLLLFSALSEVKSTNQPKDQTVHTKLPIWEAIIVDWYITCSMQFHRRPNALHLMRIVHSGFPSDT